MGSYPAVSPLPSALATRAGEEGGLFSVALSSAFPPPGVTRHRTLWSSDFPPADVAHATAAGDRLFDVDASTLVQAPAVAYASARRSIATDTSQAGSPTTLEYEPETRETNALAIPCTA